MPALISPLLRSALRHYPLLSGRGTLVQMPPLRDLRFDEERLSVRLDNGYRVVVFPNEFIGRSVYYFGDIDPKVTATVRRLLGPGDTLIDVGANVGVLSLHCLPSVGPAGRVVAVEPQPACCDALRETIALNGICNLELHSVALSDRDGRLPLALNDPDNLGTARLGPGGASIAEVEVRCGSDFLASLNLTGEYVVKIDVEGHEVEVLRGCRSYWERHPPRGVVFESFTAASACQILGELGYRVFAIPKSLLGLRYVEVREDSPPAEATDFVAVRPDAVTLLSS